VLRSAVSFFSDALATRPPGISLGILLGLNPPWLLIPFCRWDLPCGNLLVERKPPAHRALLNNRLFHFLGLCVVPLSW